MFKGPDEDLNGTIKIKNMDTGNQQVIADTDLVGTVSALLQLQYSLRLKFMPPESQGQAQRAADIAPLVLGVKIAARVVLQFDQSHLRPCS